MAKSRDTGYTPTEELQDDPSLRSKEELLGPSGVSGPGDMALLRLSYGSLRRELAEALGVKEVGQTDVTISKRSAAPLIVGPALVHKLEELAVSGLIEATDEILRTGDRWKAFSVVFPALRTQFSEDREEVTAAHTVSQGASGGLDLESIEDDPNPPSTTLEVKPVYESDEIVEPLRGGGASLATPTRVAPSIEKRPSMLTQAKARSQVSALHHWMLAVVSLLKSNVFVFSLIGGAALILLVVSLALKFGPNSQMDSDQAKVAAPDSAGSDALQEAIPDYLRAQSFEDLAKTEDPLVRRIQPILRSYERGNVLLSREQETLLVDYAQAGTSSWLARRLAANQLAVSYLATQKTQSARELLEPIFEADPSDPVTLFNLSMIALIEGNLPSARELGDAQLRLSPKGSLWVAHLLSGMIHAASPNRMADAERAFSQARQLSSNNPLILGVWIQSLMKADSQVSGRVGALLKEALWMDPDRLRDSPIRAPIAGHIIMAEALEGFRRAAERVTTLTAGQRAYLRWLDGRMRLNPVAQSFSQVTSLLGQERDDLSRILLAYVQKEQGQLADAEQSLVRVLPILESLAEVPSSWPWTLFGDLSFEQGKFADATLAYEKALGRNPVDVAAVFGLAMVHRQQGQWNLAALKLNETLSLDPFFIPGLLRIERPIWHRRFHAQ